MEKCLRGKATWRARPMPRAKSCACCCALSHALLCAIACAPALPPAWHSYSPEHYRTYGELELSQPSACREMSCVCILWSSFRVLYHASKGGNNETMSITTRLYGR